MHLGGAFAVLAVLVLFLFMARTRKGFEIEVSGAAPRASGFGGFSRPRTVWFCLALSGALAGLAGIGEIAGPVGQLQPVISPGYGFTAIIVAFLGRLNPLGVLFAGILLAIQLAGRRRGAESSWACPARPRRCSRAPCWFFILASDTFIRYRVRVVQK